MEQIEFFDSDNFMFFLTSQDKRMAPEVQMDQYRMRELDHQQVNTSREDSTSVISYSRVSNPLFSRMEEEYPLSHVPQLPTRFRAKSTSKKGSLKFCRRLCKSVVPLLERDAFSMKVFRYFGTLMATFLGHLDGRFINRERFDIVSKFIFHRIWKKHRELLACTHNNKICLVTQTEWDSFFGSEGFLYELEKAAGELGEVLDLVVFDDDVNREIFKCLFKKSMFLLNVVFINSIIYCDLSKDEKFLKKVPNYETFSLIVLEPWLCKHYNHAKEKFALECCNRCKICRSGSVPPDFLYRLQRTRIKLEEVKDFYQRLGQTNIVDMTEEQVNEIFTFWGTQLSI